MSQSHLFPSDTWWSPLWSCGSSPEHGSLNGQGETFAILFEPYWLEDPRPCLLIRTAASSAAPSAGHCAGLSGSAARVWSSWSKEALLAYAALWRDAFARQDESPDRILKRDIERPLEVKLEAAFLVGAGVPLELGTVSVPKLWGEELWYTGVEKRGLCTVKLPSPGAPSQEGSSESATRWIPLPYLELALGCAKPDRGSSLVLLKELVPFDSPFCGELYTEIHTHKAETYLVTGLGSQCCPAGWGEVKLGLNPALAASWTKSSAHSFRDQLLAYEEIRARVDEALESGGYDFKAQVAARDEGPPQLEQAKRQLVLPSLRDEEKRLCADTSALFARHRLSIGDVVRVPTLTPHALQPGVRVVEFQTPSYERYILTSNQKVLTQEGWDVDEGTRLVSATLDPQAINRAPMYQKGLALRSVIEFEGLSVREVSLNGSSSGAQGHLCLSHTGESPLVLLALSGGHLRVGFTGQRSHTLLPGKGYLFSGHDEMHVTLESERGERVALLVGASSHICVSSIESA